MLLKLDIRTARRWVRNRYCLNRPGHLKNSLKVHTHIYIYIYKQRMHHQLYRWEWFCMTVASGDWQHERGGMICHQLEIFLLRQTDFVFSKMPTTSLLGSFPLRQVTLGSSANWQYRLKGRSKTFTKWHRYISRDIPQTQTFWPCPSKFVGQVSDDQTLEECSAFDRKLRGSFIECASSMIVTCLIETSIQHQDAIP